MTKDQEKKLNELLEKYNPILLNSMRLAISEDLIDLIILNKDDETFELSDLLQNKKELSNHIIRQFLKQNSSSSVLKELKEMDEPIEELKARFRKAQGKLKF